MELKFWGVRGSLPASYSAQKFNHRLNEFFQEEGLYDQAFVPLSYGTNTCCVEIRQFGSPQNEFLLCDAGTGLHDFSAWIKNKQKAYHWKEPLTFHILISHLHWDHIQGLPFFDLLYEDKHRFHFYSGHSNIKQALEVQMSAPFFPVEFKSLKNQAEFHIFKPGEDFFIRECQIQTFKQNHPGDSFAYRIEKQGKSIIYATDGEYNEEDLSSESCLQFFNKAQVLIFDAMYSLADSQVLRRNWGHSNNFIAVKLAAKAKIEKLLLFHLGCNQTDEALDLFLKDTRTYFDLYRKEHCPDAPHPQNIAIAYDGLEFSIS